MRIFITGGTGFIGRPAVRELQKQGHHLLILAREGEDIKELLSRKGKTLVIKGSLGGPHKWARELRGFRPQAALHMAWEGLPDYGAAVSEKNLIYGLELYKLLAKIGCKKVITTGSCWEYGVTQGKLSEDMPVYPFNAFSAAKNALHWLGREIARENGMNFIWTRLFFVYGPGQRRESLIPYLIECKKTGAKPAIKNPTGCNDFIYVGDVARALRMLLEKKNQNELYNIGSGKCMSVYDVTTAIYGKPLGRKPRQIKGFYADISRIKNEIGWKPLTDFTTGIKNILNNEK